MGIRQAGLAGTLVAVLAAGATVAAAGSTPVLGAKAFAPEGGGFGKAHPKSIFNGDDQDGYVGSITWTHWGSETADGTGRKPIFKTGGGYYSQMAKAQLRATDLGPCPGSTVMAYRHLDFRVPTRPGGKLGAWKHWAGGHSICTMP